MVCVLVLTDKENVPIGRSSWIFLFARIRAGYECSYWAHVAHTLCSILPHVKNRALVVGASTSAFGCHPPNGVCVGKLWTMRKRWLYIQTTMLLSFTFKAFVVARMGKEFILNSLSVMEICTLSDRIPFWSKIYIFTAWCSHLVLWLSNGRGHLSRSTLLKSTHEINSHEINSPEINSNFLEIDSYIQYG